MEAMKTLLFFLASFLVLPGVLLATGAVPDPAGGVMLQEAQRLVAAYHAGHPPSTNLLRVVYFVPKDGQPLTNYADRLDRVVSDVSGGIWAAWRTNWDTALACRTTTVVKPRSRLAFP